jgi:alkylhydroperoxidase/carboxymuconolactone decarboxylase family protein YurZ
MTDYEQTLQRLAVSDDRLLASLLAQTDADVAANHRDAQLRALCRLAALIACEATPSSYQSVVDAALAAGASVDEIIDVLIAVAGRVGSTRVVAAAPRLARVVGDDVDEAFDTDQPRSSSALP